MPMSRRILLGIVPALLGLAPGFGDDDKEASAKPDAEKYVLTFASNRFGERFDLVSVGLDGKDAKQLTHDPKGAMEPAWSPDGKTLIFVSYRGEKSQIF